MSDKLNLAIDPNRLDNEWINHPSMVHEWAVKAADAQAEYDKSKSILDIVKANLDQEIRENPDDYGLTKVTEVALESAVIAEPQYAAAVKRVNEARHKLQIFQAACNALEHRKRALSLLVELWIRDYYSDPKPRAITKEAEDFEKKAIRRRGRNRRISQQEDEGKDD